MITHTNAEIMKVTHSKIFTKILQIHNDLAFFEISMVFRKICK